MSDEPLAGLLEGTIEQVCIRPTWLIVRWCGVALRVPCQPHVAVAAGQLLYRRARVIVASGKAVRVEAGS